MSIENSMNRLEEITEASQMRLGNELSICVLHHCQAVNALRSMVVAITAISPTVSRTQLDAIQLITRVIISGISANTFGLAGYIAPDIPMNDVCREIDLILNTMHETHNIIQKERNK